MIMIESKVSRGIISTYFEKMERNLELDVAIVGGGPTIHNLNLAAVTCIGLPPFYIFSRNRKIICGNNLSCECAVVGIEEN